MRLSYFKDELSSVGLCEHLALQKDFIDGKETPFSCTHLFTFVERYGRRAATLDRTP